MATLRRPRGSPSLLILDSGAVIALSRGDARARASLAAARHAGAQVVVPAVVLAETVRGSAHDAPVHRILKAVGAVASAEETTGHLAGRLLGSTGSAETVDALVVASAIERGGGVIATSDPGDLQVLAGDHPEVVIQAL